MVVRRCDVQLSEFLRSIKKDPSRADFQAMINILITHAQSSEELVQVSIQKRLPLVVPRTKDLRGARAKISG